MSRMTYSHSANSMAMYTRLYATADSLIQRVNQQGEDWYHKNANDLHLHDFIWFAQMQTAQRMRDRGARVRNIDRVLDQLLAEGIFDREEPNMRSAVEEMSMAHCHGSKATHEDGKPQTLSMSAFSLTSASSNYPSSSTRPTNRSKDWNNGCLPTVPLRTAFTSSCTSMDNTWKTLRRT